MENLTLEQVKHNFNVGDVVTVTSDRDTYAEESMEAEMLKYEGKKLIVESIVIIDEQLVQYLCIDAQGNSPMLWEERLAFIDADLKPFVEVEKSSKYIESVTTDKVELEVYECECGFHLGIDATYIDQVGDCSFICPSCGISISTIRKLKFSTINEGLEAIKQACDEAEISEGEFADYLVLNYSECFDGAVEPVIAIQAIQKFRQSDYETEGEDAIETFGGTEALSDNGYYGFIFMRNGQSMQLPDGVRVGIQTEDGGIALDEGIVACFKKEDNEHKPIKRVHCDCCENAYYDFVLTNENISANPLYLCTMCSEDMEKRNKALVNGERDIVEPCFSNKEIEKAHNDFADFKKANEIIDWGNL